MSLEATLTSRRGAEPAWLASVGTVCAPEQRAGRTVVVGLGNEIAGDDAVGILAAREIGRRLGTCRNLDVVELFWAGLYLLEALRGYRRAILIDCLCSRGARPPGSVVRLSEDDLAGSVRLLSFHDVNYATAMALGRSVGWPMPQQVEIFAVEGQRVDEFTTEITPAVASGLEEVVHQVLEVLEESDGDDVANG